MVKLTIPLAECQPLLQLLLGRNPHRPKAGTVTIFSLLLMGKQRPREFPDPRGCAAKRGIDRAVLNRAEVGIIWVGAKGWAGRHGAGGPSWVSVGNIQDAKAKSLGQPSGLRLISQRALPKGFHP